MSPETVGNLVDLAIPLAIGAYAAALGLRVVGKRQGESADYDRWHARWGPRLAVIGALLVAITLARAAASARPSSARPAALTWRREITADGACTAEFPGRPRADRQELDGVAHHRLELFMESLDCDFRLTYSDVSVPDDTAADAILDHVRDHLAAQRSTTGAPLTIEQEQRLDAQEAPGRALVLAVGASHVVLAKILLRGRRVYRAIAIVPQDRAKVAHAQRFVESVHVPASGRRSER